MSFIPLRDNRECAGLPSDAYERLVPLGDLIEESNARAYHQSECSRYCTDPECRILCDAQLGSMPSTEAVLGWLVAQGLLDLDAAEQFAADAGDETSGSTTDPSTPGRHSAERNGA